MSEALEKARDNLYRSLSSIPAAMAIEALVNALLDAREAKAEPDPRDARIAELERERDEAHEHARRWQDRKQVWKGCAETAEAALAELRGRVEKAVEKLQWDIDHPATMGHDRGEIIAVLTHPTTPDALLTDPVPATTEKTDD